MRSWMPCSRVYHTRLARERTMPRPSSAWQFVAMVGSVLPRVAGRRRGAMKKSRRTAVERALRRGAFMRLVVLLTALSLFLGCSNSASTASSSGELATCGSTACSCRGASCTHACDVGGCDQECQSGTCTFSCRGGGCKQFCADGAVCELSCEGPGCTQVGSTASAHLSCSGGRCRQERCGQAQCSCSGGDCVTSP